jgi:NADH-quinone oxidoreductase subunit H
MMTCLKYFLPMSCVLLVGVCVWQLVVPSALANAVKYILAFGCVIGSIAVIGSLFRSPGTAAAPSGALPGAWEGRPVVATPKK